MQTFLICGGTKEERLENALQKGKGIAKEDLILVNQEEDFGIEDVRELIHRLNLKPYRSPYKVCVIVDTQTLSVPAQNALLKTLEEPPRNTVIILTAPHPESLLSTVVSRCQIIELPPKSGIEISEEEIQNQLLAISYQLSAKVAERLKSAAKVATGRQNSLDYLNQQTIVWRKILWRKLQVSKASLFDNERFKDLTARQVAQILHHLQKTKQMIEGNINARLAVEVYFLDLPIL